MEGGGMMAKQVGIRDFLKQQGINNIGWDNQRKQATVGGKPLNVNTTIDSNNRSFANQDELMSAIQRIRQNQTQQTTGQPTQPTLPVQNAQPSNYQSNVADIISSLQQRMNQPIPQFNYNPFQDEQYINALSTANRNAQQASNQNLAEMNRRGILNSTITSDRGARIQQQELGRVTSEVLPQLINQAYQRYLNEQNLQQQQLQNLAGLADQMQGYDQQAWQNRFNYGQAIGQFNNGQRTLEAQRLDMQRQGQQFDQDMAREQIAYQRARDQIADQRYQREFDEDVRRFGLQFAMDKAYREGQLQLSQDQLGLSQERFDADQQQQQLDNLYRQWQTTGIAPQGIPNVPAGTPLPSQSPRPTSQQLEAQYTSYIGQIPANRREEFFESERDNIIAELGITGYNRLLSLFGIGQEEETDPVWQRNR